MAPGDLHWIGSEHNYCFIIIHDKKSSCRQVKFIWKLKCRMGCNRKLFGHLDLSLVSGKMGGVMGVTDDDTKLNALYQNGKIDMKVKTD